ncbi:MAG: hypothetical protein RIS70_4234 [Planctomycetota bacterium]
MGAAVLGPSAKIARERIEKSRGAAANAWMARRFFGNGR